MTRKIASQTKGRDYQSAVPAKKATQWGPTLLQKRHTRVTLAVYEQQEIQTTSKRKEYRNSPKEKTNFYVFLIFPWI